MSRTPQASPTLTPDFGTLLAGLDLLCYAHDMAVEMAETASPPLCPPQTYNRGVLGLLELEAKEGNKIDRD